MPAKAKPLFSSREKLVVYTDGGARGNPGPSALGVIVGDKQYGEYLGIHTNNFAEYQAIIFALKKAKQLLGKKRAKETEVELRTDSELAVKQLNGEYRIEEPELQLLFVDAWNLRLDFKKVTFAHVPRECNRQADALVNRALDAAGGQRGRYI
jgi:ribonuclease HI